MNNYDKEIVDRIVNVEERWDRVKRKILLFFLGDDLRDAISDATASGFADGHVAGHQLAYKNILQAPIDNFALGLEEGRRQTYTQLRAVDPHSIITKSAEGKLMLGREVLTNEQKKSLKEEWSFIKMTKLWQIWQNTLADTARTTMFEKSNSFEDMRTGKAMLFNLDIQKKIGELIEAA